MFLFCIVFYCVVLNRHHGWVILDNMVPCFFSADAPTPFRIGSQASGSPGSPRSSSGGSGCCRLGPSVRAPSPDRSVKSHSAPTPTYRTAGATTIVEAFRELEAKGGAPGPPMFGADLNFPPSVLEETLVL